MPDRQNVYCKFSQIDRAGKQNAYKTEIKEQ